MLAGVDGYIRAPRTRRSVRAWDGPILERNSHAVLLDLEGYSRLGSKEL